MTYLLERPALADTVVNWSSEYVLLEGKPPYHPRERSEFYLYRMMNRLRSSRGWETAQTEWSMACTAMDIGTVPRLWRAVAAIR